MRTKFGNNEKVGMIITISVVVFHIVWLVLCCKYPIYRLIKYLFLTAFSIFLPGLTITLHLKDKMSDIVRLSISYAIGYACLVLEFFAAELTNRRIPFSVITVVVGVTSMAILILETVKSNGFKSIWNKQIDLLDAVIFSGIFLINIFAYSSNNLGLEIAPEFTTGRAVQYWANNSVALKLSWPADNLFFLGDQLNYHYFSNIPIALLSDVYGISVFDLSFTLYAFTKSILLAGAVIYMFDSVGANNRIKAMGSFVLLCTAGIDSLTRVSFSSNIYRTPFGLDIGVAYGLFFITQFYRQVLSKELRMDYLISSIIFWMMNIGAKAPLSMILIIPPGFMCITWLVKREYRKAFGYGVTILFTFLLISYVCVGLFNVTSGEAAWRLCLYSPEEIFHVTPPDISDIVCSLFLKLANANPVLAVLSKILLINPAMEIVLVFSVAKFIKTHEKGDIDEDMCLFLIYSICAIIIGIVMFLIINAGASSEKYFVMATFIVGALFCAHINSSFKETRLDTIVNYYKFGSIIKVITVAIFVAGFIRFIWTDNTAVELKSVLVGIRKVYYSNYYPEKIKYDSQTVTSEDAKALYWIRDNTLRNSIVLSDKAVLTNDDDYYLYGLFTERQQFIEGTKMLGDHREKVNAEIRRRKELVRGFYIDNSVSVDELCAEGISYIIRTKELSPIYLQKQEGLSLVFASDSIEVYKIEKKG